MKSKRKDLVYFITEGLWEVRVLNLNGKKARRIKILRTIVLATREFFMDRVPVKASALAYYTILAVVPLLSLIFAIAKGFGFEEHLAERAASFLQADGVEWVVKVVERYLSNVENGGIFVGVGLLILLWSVVNLFLKVENIFNDIWEIKKMRNLGRRAMNYSALMIIIPIMLIFSSAISIYVSNSISEFSTFAIMNKAIRVVMRLLPFFIVWVMLVIFYLVVPNTKVRLITTMIPTLFTAAAFQLFQMVYINGQIALTQYNAMYGRLAMIPLTLLWLQISWFLILYGAELTFAAQNSYNYEFVTKSHKVSVRYRQFLTIYLLSLIVKRFSNENASRAYTIEELSNETQVPLKMVSEVIYNLYYLDILRETRNEGEPLMVAFVPVKDINQLTIGSVLEKIELDGVKISESQMAYFKSEAWNELVKCKKEFDAKLHNVYIKDL